MRILFVAATPQEVPFIRTERTVLKAGDRVPIQEWAGAELLITGVGMTATAYYMAESLVREQPVMAVNLGFAGALSSDCRLGEVYRVEKDCFADLGSEQADGSFVDLFELDLPIAGKEFFNDHWLFPLQPDLNWKESPRSVQAVTVNKVHGSRSSIDEFTRRYSSGLQTMEGAAFTLACRLNKVPSIQLRAVSNRVEPRNRSAWEIEKAIFSLQASYSSLMQASTGL